MFEFISFGAAVGLAGTGLWFAAQVSAARRHFRIRRPLAGSSQLVNLPSVSVCIPARNEAHAMARCLDRVIASDYPKLEIIVLDDSSGDDTSLLIKSFAHAGVRFVPGAPLPLGWLGKNYALHRLSSEASGRLVLFMDVDTQLTPTSLSQLVAYSLQESAAMISVLPRRQDGWRTSVLLGTLRYFWELIWASRSNPAVASGAWLIDRQVLGELGGFGPYRRDVQPEAKLAAVLNARRSYRFLISSPTLGISYEKKWSSQVETSIRLLWPNLGGRLLPNLLALLGLLLLNLPSLAILASLVYGWGTIQIVAAWQIGLYGAVYGLYLDRVWQKGWWFGLWLWPLVIAQETVVLIISIGRYALGRVTWKGRPITNTVGPVK